MTHMFPVLHLYSQHSFCLPCLPHLHLFTYSTNTIEHLSCVRPYTYQRITLTLCRLESSLLKSYDSCKASSYRHCLHELLLGLLARSDHLIIALFTSLIGLSMPDASYSFFRALIIAVLSAPRALPRLLIVRSFTSFSAQISHPQKEFSSHST